MCAGVFSEGWQLIITSVRFFFACSRSAISTNKAAILKAVGSTNEAAATKLVADLDLGLGKPLSTGR